VKARAARRRDCGWRGGSDEAVGMTKRWWLQLIWRRHGWRHCSDRVADERGPHGFVFSQIIQIGSNLEIFPNSQFLHVARLGNYKKISQLF
jgi:hypothetical protein